MGDTPDAWRAAGFHVRGDALQLGRTTIELHGDGPAGSPGGGFLGWRFDPPPTAGAAGPVPDIDGLPVLAGEPSRSAETVGGAHPNGISRIDHLVVLTGDVGRTLGAFGSAGFELRRQRRTEIAGSPAVQSFLWAGDVIIELVGPAPEEPTSEGPATIFGLALVSADLDATAEHLGESLGPARDAVQPGRRIATVRHRALGISLPVAVMSPHPG